MRACPRCVLLTLLVSLSVFVASQNALAQQTEDEIAPPDEAAAGFGAGPDAEEPVDEEGVVTDDEAAESEADGDSEESKADDVQREIDAEAAEEEEAAGDLGGVERITVTATKREESFQEVPISMSALDSSFIEETGLTEFAGIQKFVPNMSIDSGTDTRGTTIRIRGIGSTGTNSGIDPSVGLFIDGIYQGRAGMSMGDLVDIERVEVLRGPQGTLYGKNTAAGLVHVITKRPTYEYSTFAEGIFGSYDTFEGRGSINIPILDEHIATRLSLYRSVRGGWDTNLFTGEEVNDADKWGVRNKWLFDITDEVSLLVSGDYAKEDTKCCVPDILTYQGDSLLWGGGNPPRGQFVAYNQNRNFAKINGFYNEPLPTDRPNNPNGNLSGRYIPFLERKPFLRNFEPFDEQVDVDVSPSNEVFVWGVSMDWDFALPHDIDLNWLSSYRQYGADSVFDGDFSQYDAVLSFTNSDLQQASTELRISQAPFEWFDYTAGAYGYFQDQDTESLIGYEQDFADIFIAQGQDFEYFPVGNIDSGTFKTYTAAGFGQVNFNWWKLRLTAGLRGSWERKTLVGSQISNIDLDAPPVSGPDDFRDDARNATNFSPMAKLQYFPTDEAMVYASFATGFKSGGFNQLRTAQDVSPEFDDETSYNYELGARTAWFENRLTVNATGFFTDYQDFQALSFTGTAISVRNAGSFYSYGFEADTVLVPMEGLMWRTALGFNITEYQDFDAAENTIGNIVELARDLPRVDLLTGEVGPGELAPLSFNLVCVPGDEPGQFPEGCNTAQNLKGRRLDNAPRWSFSTSLHYEVPIFDLPFKWMFHTDYSFRSTIFLNQDLDPNLKEPDLHLLDFRTGLKSDEGLFEGRVGWELIFWVRNTLDEQYNAVGFDVPVMGGFAGVHGPPRQFGGTVRLMY